MNKKIGVFLVFLCTLIIAGGQYFLKKSMDNVVFDLSLIYNTNLIIGIFLYALGAFVLIIALKFGPLSTLYPIISLNFIWVAFISVRFLGEKISLAQYTGLGLVLLGVIFVAGGRK